MPGLLDSLSASPQQQAEPEFKPSYLRPELLGGFGTPTLAALLQMFDPMGLSPQQMDRNDAMRGPLLQGAYQANPQFMTMPRDPVRQGLNSTPEDLNSVMLKYGNWRQQNVGPLTPQQRITQGFMDVRNPNSWF